MNKYKITIYLVSGQFICTSIDDERDIREVRKDYDGFQKINTLILSGENDKQIVINCSNITHIVINKGE